MFLCLTLFVYSTQHFGSNEICIVIIGLKLTNSSLLPFNKAQDLDTKLQKPFSPLSPNTESPLATQRTLVPPDLSISTWLVTPNPSQPPSRRGILCRPGMHMFFFIPYKALNLFNPLYKAEDSCLPHETSALPWHTAGRPSASAGRSLKACMALPTSMFVWSNILSYHPGHCNLPSSAAPVKL